MLKRTAPLAGLVDSAPNGVVVIDAAGFNDHHVEAITDIQSLSKQREHLVNHGLKAGLRLLLDLGRSTTLELAHAPTPDWRVLAVHAGLRAVGGASHRWQGSLALLVRG